MFLFVHAPVGAVTALAITTQNPLLAFFIAFASHFLLDMIPHGDEHLGDHISEGKARTFFYIKLGIFDLAFVLAEFVFFVLFFPTENYFVLGAAFFGAVLPDILQGLSFFFDHSLLIKYTHWHNRAHAFFKKQISFRYGAMVQIVTFFAAHIIFIKVISVS